MAKGGVVIDALMRLAGSTVGFVAVLLCWPTWLDWALTWGTGWGLVWMLSEFVALGFTGYTLFKAWLDTVEAAGRWRRR